MTEPARYNAMQAVVRAEQQQLPVGELEKIFEQHHRLVFRAAYRVTGDSSDAEDVLQTVFLRLARRPPEADGVRGLESYLYRAAVNTALDIVRSRARKPDVPLDDALPSAAPTDSPDRVLEANEVRRWLREAIARLSGRSAEIFVLRFFEGKENAEIAGILGTTPSTVAVTLHRTRERLHREFMAQSGGVK